MLNSAISVASPGEDVRVPSMATSTFAFPYESDRADDLLRAVGELIWQREQRACSGSRSCDMTPTMNLRWRLWKTTMRRWLRRQLLGGETSRFSTRTVIAEMVRRLLLRHDMTLVEPSIVTMIVAAFRGLSSNILLWRNQVRGMGCATA